MHKEYGHNAQLFVNKPIFSAKFILVYTCDCVANGNVVSEYYTQFVK